MSTRARLAQFGAIGALCAAASIATAQEVNFGAIDSGQKHMAHVRTGGEYAFVVGAGYAHIFRVGDRPLLVGGDVTLPWATFDLGDYRVRAEAMAPIVGHQQWKLAGRVAPMLRGLDDELARFTNFGVETGVVGGYYALHWMVAAELGLDWAISTHIKHSQRYRNIAYEDAKNGWYRNTGANFNYGLIGGGSFSRFDLLLRAEQAGGPPASALLRSADLQCALVGARRALNWWHVTEPDAAQRSKTMKDASPQQHARIAGAAYVLVIVIGVLNGFLIDSRLMVPESDAATTQNIIAHPNLFRSPPAALLC